MSIVLLAFTIPPCLDVLYWTCRLTGFALAQVIVFYRSPVSNRAAGFYRGFGKGTASAVPLASKRVRALALVVRPTSAQSRRRYESALVFEVKYFKYTLFRTDHAPDR